MEQQVTDKQVTRRRLWRAAMFYGIVLVAVLGVLLVIGSAKKPLNSWLEEYQAQQYQNTADEIYELLFAQPDWALLYDMAGVENTKFEGKADYAAYMQARVGDKKLTCTQIPTGLEPYKAYSIRLEGQQIAGFTMVPTEDSRTGWTLGQVQLDISRNQSVTVTVPMDCTVYINKVALDDSYTTLSVNTLAEKYLQGTQLHGYRCRQQTVTGLLTQPEVIVLDAYGRPLELTQDPETGIFTAPIPTSEPITEEEYDRVLAAAQADALFCLQQLSISQLRQYFDPTGQAYNELLTTEFEPLSIAECRIDENSVRIFDYYRYSEELFSVHVQLSVICTDENGTETAVPTDVSYFMAPNSAGNYMVTVRTQEDLQQQVTSEAP